jgi:hypothetical protein
MRADLSYYIASPSHLDEVSITELENSISEQPFNQTLRMLLAKKTFGRSVSLLQDAAVSSTERNFLKYTLLNETQSGSETQSGNEGQLISASDDATAKIDLAAPSIDVHVFKDSEDRELEYTEEASEKSIIMNSISDVIKEETDIIPDSKEYYPLSQVIEDTAVSSEQYNNGIHSDDKALVHDESYTLAKEVDNTHNVNTSEKLDKTKKKKKTKKSKKLFKLDDYSGTSDYVLWLCSLSGKDVKTKKKQKKKSKIDETVKRSITKSDSIISEPLADLLASQGHSADAIKMYDQLILKIPEKSVYFAAKIDLILKNNTE